MPGVSRKTTCASGSVRMPRMRLRVVCGLGVTMATLAPTSAFSSVDLPTFGRPTMAAYPARWAILRRAAERHPRSHRAARVGDQSPQRDAPVHGDDDGDGRGARGVERRGQGERADRLGERLVVGGRGRIAAARARREETRAAHRAGLAERQALAPAARVQERTAGVEDVQTERYAERAVPIGRAVGIALGFAVVADLERRRQVIAPQDEELLLDQPLARARA